MYEPNGVAGFATNFVLLRTSRQYFLLYREKSVVNIQRRSGKQLFPLLVFVLLTETELRNQFAITVNVLVAQVVQQVTAMTYHFQKTTTGVVVFLVRAQVVVQVVDLVGQDRDLNFRGPGVSVVYFKSFDQVLFSFLADPAQCPWPRCQRPDHRTRQILESGWPPARRRESAAQPSRYPPRECLVAAPHTGAAWHGR